MSDFEIIRSVGAKIACHYRNEELLQGRKGCRLPDRSVIREEAVQGRIGMFAHQAVGHPVLDQLNDPTTNDKDDYRHQNLNAKRHQIILDQLRQPNIDGRFTKHLYGLRHGLDGRIV